MIADSGRSAACETFRRPISVFAYVRPIIQFISLHRNNYSFERLYLRDGLPSGMENSLALCGRKAGEMENYCLDSYACVQQLASLAMSKQEGEEMEKIDAFRQIQGEEKEIGEAVMDSNLRYDAATSRSTPFGPTQHLLSQHIFIIPTLKRLHIPTHFTFQHISPYPHQIHSHFH